MVKNPEHEVRVKDILTEELAYYTLTDTKNDIGTSIRNFFKSWESKPLSSLFSSGGVAAVTAAINNSPIKPELIEFLLRIKSSVNSNKGIYTEVYEVLSVDYILDDILENEVDKLEIASPKDLEPYYVLVLIYVYNTVALDIRKGKRL